MKRLTPIGVLLGLTIVQRHRVSSSSSGDTTEEDSQDSDMQSRDQPYMVRLRCHASDSMRTEAVCVGRTNTTASAERRARALHAVEVLADRHARVVALVHGRAARRRREQRPARRGVARVLRLGGRRRQPRVGPRLELVQPARRPRLACAWDRWLLVIAASARRAWACSSCRIRSVEPGQGRATCLDPDSGSSGRPAPGLHSGSCQA